MTNQPFDNLPWLARRAVACKHWRWMDGMRVICTPRHDGATGYFIRLEQDGYRAAQNEYPDLSDPATMGCILALVREAHGERSLHVRQEDWCWRVWTDKPYGFDHETEAAALVAALEAAP